MALKITLKPRERVILGGAVITNGPSKTEFSVENEVPVLRQKNILGAEEAISPARRIYFVIQLMYVDNQNLKAHHELYWELVQDFLSAAPRSIELIDRLNDQIFQMNYYQALKLAKKLIDFEQEVIKRATQCS
ncbi:MAG: flagellar protein FlbT [Desulfobacteraceae bacterium]|nr:flagellar protein FlbT [Desulfobacteraceae bacterium]